MGKDYYNYEIPKYYTEQANNVNCIIMADLHWGAIDPDEYWCEILDGILSYLDNLSAEERLDYIIIAGDLFDTKEMFSSYVTKKVIDFVHYLLMYCMDSRWSTKVIMLEGTRTHDNFQPEMIQHIFSKEIWIEDRIEVYNTVASIKTDNGASILFIPEEYISDQESYYAKYFKPGIHYDLIVGHGMIDKIWYAKKDNDALNELTKHMSAPVFKVDELLEHCTRCYFGHVHMNKSYGDGGRFSYIGPYSNWEFGKSTKVGFYHVKINTKTGEVTDTYIENTNAKNYPTVAMKISDNMSLTELNDRVDTIIANVYATTSNVGKVRLIVVLSQTIETWQTMKDFLVSKCGDMPNLKFVLQLEEDNSNEDTTTDDEEKSSKKYLFDHSIDITHRIQTFIRNKSGRDIPIETIEKYLNS